MRQITEQTYLKRNGLIKSSSRNLKICCWLDLYSQANNRSERKPEKPEQESLTPAQLKPVCYVF